MIMKKFNLIIFCISVFMITNTNAACNIQKYSFGSGVDDVMRDFSFQFPMGHGMERTLLLDGKETCPADERLWGVPITLVFIYDELVQYQISNFVNKPQLNTWLEEQYGIEIGSNPGLFESIPNFHKSWVRDGITVLYSIGLRNGEVVEYIEITSSEHDSLFIKKNKEFEESL